MNFFGYEKVIPPPIGLPKNMTTCYITDNEINFSLAKSLGWQIVKKTEKFRKIKHKLDKRISVAELKCFPQKFIPEVQDFDFIFICDSNILEIREDYEEFVNGCTADKCLFVTSGFYTGFRDTIFAELEASNQERWSYNFENIKKSTKKYIDELTHLKINLANLSVVSGKYIGWNLKHPSYEELSNRYYKERQFSLQGNIILTYLSGIFPDLIYNFKVNSNFKSKLNSHNLYQ